MNQAEWRRKKLLEQMRVLYSDNRSIPAIHPRYKMMYQHIYDDEYKVRPQTFGMRVGVCVLILFLYIAMEYNGNTVLGFDNMQVLEAIMHNVVWKLY